MVRRDAPFDSWVESRDIVTPRVRVGPASTIRSKRAGANPHDATGSFASAFQFQSLGVRESMLAKNCLKAVLLGALPQGTTGEASVSRRPETPGTESFLDAIEPSAIGTAPVSVARTA